ncbi:DUF4129 domain-containing protein [Mycolicibacterium thermoresistibile]
MDSRTTSLRRPLTTLALLTATVVALRGYLPGASDDPAPPAEPRSGGLHLIVVAVMLAISLAVLAMAVISQLRNRRATAVGPPDRDAWRRGGGKRPTWRGVLLVLGVLIGYLMLVAFLARVFAPLVPEQPESETGAQPAPGPDTTTPWADPPAVGTTAMPYLLAATVVFVLLVVIGSIAARRRNRPVAAASTAVAFDQPPPSADGNSDPLARAAAMGLAEIGDLSREPRDAIIACYAAMERELARVPEAAPQQFDTASEVLARAVEHRALSAGSATRLVELFGEARFSRHVMREEHRDAAVQALQVVLAQLRGAT